MDWVFYYFYYLPRFFQQEIFCYLPKFFQKEILWILQGTLPQEFWTYHMMYMHNFKTGKYLVGWNNDIIATRSERWSWYLFEFKHKYNYYFDLSSFRSSNLEYWLAWYEQSDTLVRIARKSTKRHYHLGEGWINVPQVYWVIVWKWEKTLYTDHRVYWTADLPKFSGIPGVSSGVYLPPEDRNLLFKFLKVKPFKYKGFLSDLSNIYERNVIWRNNDDEEGLYYWQRGFNVVRDYRPHVENWKKDQVKPGFYLIENPVLPGFMGWYLMKKVGQGCIATTLAIPSAIPSVLYFVVNSLNMQNWGWYTNVPITLINVLYQFWLYPLKYYILRPNEWWWDWMSVPYRMVESYRTRNTWRKVWRSYWRFEEWTGGRRWENFDRLSFYILDIRRMEEPAWWPWIHKTRYCWTWLNIPYYIMPSYDKRRLKLNKFHIPWNLGFKYSRHDVHLRWIEGRSYMLREWDQFFIYLKYFNKQAAFKDQLHSPLRVTQYAGVHKYWRDFNKYKEDHLFRMVRRVDSKAITFQEHPIYLFLKKNMKIVWRWLMYKKYPNPSGQLPQYQYVYAPPEFILYLESVWINVMTTIMESSLFFYTNLSVRFILSNLFVIFSYVRNFFNDSIDTIVYILDKVFNYLIKKERAQTIYEKWRTDDKPIDQYLVELWNKVIIEDFKEVRIVWDFEMYCLNVFVMFAFHYAVLHFFFWFIRSTITFFWWMMIIGIPELMDEKRSIKERVFSWFVRPYYNWLLERSIIRYLWVKYDVTYERLVHYPTTVFIHYVILSFLDLLVYAPNSYWAWVHRLDDGRRVFLYKLGVFDVCWQKDWVETEYFREKYWYGWTVSHSFQVMIYIILLYHFFFWLSFIFKKLYFWGDKYDEYIFFGFITATFSYEGRNWLLYSKRFWSALEIQWLVQAWYIPWVIFLYFFSIFINEEEEWVHDPVHRAINFPFTWWLEFGWHGQWEQFIENSPCDLNWEFRELRYLSKKNGFSYEVSIIRFKEFTKKERAKSIDKKRVYQYTFQDWKYMLERHSRNHVLFDFTENVTQTSRWEQLMVAGKGNPYGNYDVNEFTLYGLLPKIHNFVFTKLLSKDYSHWLIFRLLIPRVITLPWQDGIYFNLRIFGFTLFRFRIQFTRDFLDFTLTPIYLFIKNPIYTTLNYESPWVMKNWYDLDAKGMSSGLEHNPDADSIYFYYMLQDEDLERAAYRLYEPLLIKFHNDRLQMILGDNHYGSRKIFFDGHTVIWDLIKYTRSRSLFMIFRIKLWNYLGMDFSARRIQNRQKFKTFMSLWNRYTLVEHIFFRKKLKMKEFQLRLEMEELVRVDAIRHDVDRRRLKTANRKRIY